jgi:rubrerythrin
MKKKYRCDNCRFSFETEKEVKKCPYCDKERLFTDTKDQDLLTDVDSLLK